MQMGTFSPRHSGEVVVFRGVSRTKIWYVLPVTVVQDTPNLLALYWPAGTCGKWRMKSSFIFSHRPFLLIYTLKI